jgi:hypothetical protein
MMSNIQLFENMSDSYKQLLSKLQPETVFTGYSGGSNRLSIRGSVFRKLVNGEEVGTLEDRALQVVFVKAAPVSRTYYAEKYKEGEVVNPTCWSADGRFPHPDVLASDRQGQNCGDCPMNIKGSGEGEARACRFQQRVVILLPNAEKEFVSDTPYLLSLPAKSLFGDNKEKMSMQAYVRKLHAHQTPLAAVVTEMRFDTDSSTPRLFFKPIRPLEEDELKIVARLQTDPEVDQLLVMDYKQKVEAEEVADSQESGGSLFAAPAEVKKKSEKKAKPALTEEFEEMVAEPVEEPKVKSKPAPTPAPEKIDLSDVMGEWDD